MAVSVFMIGLMGDLVMQEGEIAIQINSSCLKNNVGFINNGDGDIGGENSIK